MKRPIVSLCICLFAACLAVGAHAADAAASGPRERRDAAGEVFDEGGGREIFEGLDDATRSLLSSAGMDPEDPRSVAQISPGGVFKTALGLVSDGLGGAARHLSVLVGMQLLLAFAAQLCPDRERGSPVSVMTLFFFAAVEAPVLTDIAACSLSAISAVSALGKLLVPFMGVLVASSGAPLASASATGAGVAAVQAVGAAVDHVFVPLVGAFGAVCAIGAADEMFDLERGMKLLKKIFTVLLGGCATLFAGALALRSVAAKAADGLAYKSARFLIGGLVPVVGGAMSEGLGALTASLDLLNDTVGAFGIAAAGFILLPALIRSALHRAVLWIASLVGELAGQGRTGRYLAGVSETLGMLELLLMFDGFVFLCVLGALIRAM